MEFSSLPAAVPLYDWQPATMNREGEALNAAIADLLARRAQVSELSEANRKAWEADHTHDRRDFCKAIIACLENELVLRPRLEIYFLAQSRALETTRGEAQEKLRTTESEIRQSLGFGPDQILPPAALQIDPLWHANRRAVEAMPSGIDTADALRANAAATHQCKSHLTHFRGVLHEQEITQKRLAREKEAATKRLAAAQTAREEVVDAREQAIEQLLRSDVSVRGRASRPAAA